MGLIFSNLIYAHKGDWHPPFLELVLAFNTAVYILHTYLDVRQLRVRKAGKKSACCLTSVDAGQMTV